MQLTLVLFVIIAISSICSQQLTDDGCYYEYLNTRVMCLDPLEVCKNIENCDACTTACTQYSGQCQSAVYKQSSKECFLYQKVVSPTYGRRRRASGCYGNTPPLVIKNNPDFTYYIVSNSSTCKTTGSVTTTIEQPSSSESISQTQQNPETTSQSDQTIFVANSISTETTNSQQQDQTTPFNNPPMSQETTGFSSDSSFFQSSESSQSEQTNAFVTSSLPVQDTTTVNVASFQPEKQPTEFSSSSETSAFPTDFTSSQATDLAIALSNSSPYQETTTFQSTIFPISLVSEEFVVSVEPQQPQVTTSVLVQQETTTLANVQELHNASLFKPHLPQKNHPQKPLASRFTEDVHTEGTHAFVNITAASTVSDVSLSTQFPQMNESTVQTMLSEDQNSSISTSQTIENAAQNQETATGVSFVEIQVSISSGDFGDSRSTSGFSQIQDTTTTVTSTSKLQETIGIQETSFNSSVHQEITLLFNTTDLNESNQTEIQANASGLFPKISEFNENAPFVLLVNPAITFSNSSQRGGNNFSQIIETKMDENTDMNLHPSKQGQHMEPIDLNNLQPLAPAPLCVFPECRLKLHNF